MKGASGNVILEPTGSYSCFKLINWIFFFFSEIAVVGTTQFPPTFRWLLICFFSIMSTQEWLFPMLFPRNYFQICFISLLSPSCDTRYFHLHAIHQDTRRSYMTPPKWKDPGKCSPCVVFPVTMLHHGREYQSSVKSWPLNYISVRIFAEIWILCYAHVL